VYYGGGDVSVCEFTGRGTHDGELFGIPATGRAAQLPYCEVLHFDAGGKVTSGEAYYDRMTLMEQLGLAQVPETATAQIPRPAAPAASETGTTAPA
jgi:hypothetical protein